MADKRLMTGNEACARGAWEAGAALACSYPGTPATEIIQFLAAYPDLHTEWCTNEKVALEVAIGASFGGGRAIASMKQVGVNVAADPLFSVAYAGVNAGLVIITADEPGLHSSQNEQDNRYYAKFAQIPMLEPSDSQETKEMVALAFEISEQNDIPCFVRLTTRICHTRSLVELGPRQDVPRRPYVRDIRKYAMVPSHAYQRHFDLEKRQIRLEAMSNTYDGNRIEMRSLDYGVVTSGVSYQNVREALPEFSVLKIGMTYPVPQQIIRNFASQVKYLYVVEENRPVLEEEILALETSALDPVRFLVVPRLLAIMIMQPCLTIIADVVGIFGGFVVGTTLLNIDRQIYLTKTIDYIMNKDIYTGLVKAEAFALIIGLVAAYEGFNVRRAAEDVGKATTASVVLAIVYIIAADCFFTALFYFILRD